MGNPSDGMECGTAKPHQFRRLWQIRKEPQYANRRLCSEASLAARGRCLIMESHQSSLWVAAVGSPPSFPHFQRCKTYTPGSSLGDTRITLMDLISTSSPVARVHRGPVCYALRVGIAGFPSWP